MTGPAVAAGARVRWRDGHRWRHGHLVFAKVGVNNTLTIRHEHGIKCSTVQAGLVEHETTGPRGGHRWEPITPAAAPAASKRPRRLNPVLAGQMALFPETGQ